MSNNRIKIRKVDEELPGIIRDEKPPSEEEGYELVYKNIPKPHPRRYAKEEFNPQLGKIRLESRLAYVAKTPLGKRIATLLIYLCLIGGLTIILYLVALTLFIHPGHAPANATTTTTP